MYHTDTSGLSSAGVMAVTRAECDSRGLLAIPDPGQFSEHVLIDLGHITKSMKNTARYLADLARRRGWCYRPDAPVNGQQQAL